jgi:glutathione S-transferase
MAPMLRIFGYAASINVRKVLWTCEEIGIRFVREDWGGAFRSTSDPELLAKNPVGMVPVVEDGETTVWESNTIVRYLASSRGRHDLLPAEPHRRAHVEQWMDWQASDLNNTWRYAFQALVRRNPQYDDPRAVEASIRQFTGAMAIIDAQLGETASHIAGSDFTAADIAIGLAVHRWLSTPFDKPRYDHVDRYYRRLSARPAFARYGRDGRP